MKTTEEFIQQFFIQRLESRLNQALEDMRMLGRMGANVCPVCTYYNHGEGGRKCITCPKMDNFRWHGLVKEDC